MSWKHISPESRERSRQMLLARWADPEYRARHTARLRTLRLGKGKRISPEEQRLRWKVKKELWRAKRDALGLPS